MSFLFGRKEKEKKSGSREIGPPGPALNASREAQKLAAGAPQQNPANSVNNSVNSVGSDASRRPDQERQVSYQWAASNSSRSILDRFD